MFFHQRITCFSLIFIVPGALTSTNTQQRCCLWGAKMPCRCAVTLECFRNKHLMLSFSGTDIVTPDILLFSHKANVLITHWAALCAGPHLSVHRHQSHPCQRYPSSLTTKQRHCMPLALLFPTLGVHVALCPGPHLTIHCHQSHPCWRYEAVGGCSWYRAVPHIHQGGR